MSPNSSNDPELEIQRILSVKIGAEDVNLSDADFDRITEILCQAKREEWGLRPRTYVLLRMIDAIDLMDDFVQSQCWDIALPYTRENLPQRLSTEQRDHFLQKQVYVLTKAARLEGGSKSRHANFASNADSHLKSLKRLGEGGSGTVDLVISKLSRKKYARKRLDRKKTFQDSAQALKFFRNEVDLLKKLDHHHLVRFIGSYTDPEYVGIIMEPVADMNLLEFLSQSSFNSGQYDSIREAFGCLCAAFMYLQRMKCRHKDIKPQNILVKELKVYVTDFGIARDWKAVGRSTTTGDIGPISKAYAAPEVVARDPRNSSSDIWSLGCVYLDMITVLKGETLESKLAHFRSSGSSGEDPRVNEEAFKDWMGRLQSTRDNAPLEWIKNMILKDPEDRLKPEELMSRILTFEGESGYYGLCCGEEEESDLPPELRDGEVDVLSSSEDPSDDNAPEKKAPDQAVLESHLCSAAHNQDVKSLKRWLRKARRLRNSCLNTHSIHRAAANGNEEIVDILIHFGCNLELKQNDWTPLSTAVLNGREGTTELLASTKIAVDGLDPGESDSPLHLAAHRSFHSGMKSLLKAGASIDIRNNFQATPLHVATDKGNLLGVKLLLEHCATVSCRDRNGHSALRIAATHGFDEIVRVLLDYGAEINEYDASKKSLTGGTALLWAIRSKNPAVVQTLLERGAEINLQIKAERNLVGSPLHFAASDGFLEVTKILLKYKPDLESRDGVRDTPLLSAGRRGQIEAAKLLLEAGADIEAKLNPYNTILTALVLRKQLDFAQLLIDRGASLAVQGQNKEILLHHAAARGDTETTGFLLKNKSDVVAQDVKGITPLMLAAQSGETAGMRMLIAYGAPLDSRDHKGQTPLHYAAGSGSTEATSLLLEHGADPFRLPKRAPSALRVAERQGHKAVEDLMLKALEDAGRLVHDPRWPDEPLPLTLRELKHGYKVVDKGGRPSISVSKPQQLASPSLTDAQKPKTPDSDAQLSSQVSRRASFDSKKAVSDDTTP